VDIPCYQHATSKRTARLVVVFVVSNPFTIHSRHCSNYYILSRLISSKFLYFLLPLKFNLHHHVTLIAYAVWRPCNDFMDMLQRLISCRIIIIITIISTGFLLVVTLYVLRMINGK